MNAEQGTDHFAAARARDVAIFYSESESEPEQIIRIFPVFTFHVHNAEWGQLIILQGAGVGENFTHGRTPRGSLNISRSQSRSQSGPNITKLRIPSSET